MLRLAGRGRRGRRGGTVWAVVFLLVLPACGSTVQWSDAIPSQGNGGTNSGVGNAEIRLDDALPNVGPEDMGYSDPDMYGADSTGARVDQRKSIASDHGTAQVDRPGAVVGGSEPGVTNGKIFIGYGTVEDVGEFASAMGFGEGESAPRQSPYAKAVVNDLNKDGGIAGREVVPVFHDVPTARMLQDPASEAQAACEDWTQDRPVFAVVSQIGVSVFDETLAACLARRAVPYVSSAFIRPQQLYNRFSPNMYGPATPTAERNGSTLIRRLIARDFFSAWDSRLGKPGTSSVKIGVLASRDSYGEHFIDFMRAELPRHGRSVSSSYLMSGDFSRAADELQSAALQFSREGITHVISAWHILFIADMFERNSYRPRHALQYLNFLYEAETQDAPKEQFNGALGASFRPGYDVDTTRRDSMYTPAGSKCERVIQRAGLKTEQRGIGTWTLAMTTCDAFYFLEAATENGNLSAQGLQTGTAAMDEMPTASTFRISFQDGRTDGAAAVRDLAWYSKCDDGEGCFKYVSGNHAM